MALFARWRNWRKQVNVTLLVNQISFFITPGRMILSKLPHRPVKPFNFEKSVLRSYNRMMADAASRPDLPAFGELNRRFHDVFLQKLDNRVLRDTCNLVRGPLYTFPVQRQTLADWLRKSVTEHRNIIKLAAAGDAAGVGAYFRDVHWNFDRNHHYITDAFDHQGEAALHL